MATNNSKLNVVAVGASAGGVEALKDLRRAYRPPSPARFWWSCTCPPKHPACWLASWPATRHCRPPKLSTAVLSERLSEVYRRDRAADE
jgi:hypothetical protein